MLSIERSELTRTGNPFLDWDEDAFDRYRQAEEEDPFAWDVDTVAHCAALCREARATLAELQPLWAALADPREAGRLAGAIILATAAGPRPGGPP